MFIFKYRKIFFTISTLLVLGTIYGAYVYGFNFGVDFLGGTITEVRYPNTLPAKDSVDEAVTALNLGGFSVRTSETDRYIIRTKELSLEESASLRNALDKLDGEVDNSIVIERANTIGPVAGSELKDKAIKAILVVILMIVLFVTFVFRKVSKPVSSWKYGLSTIICLAHDVLIPTGIFIFLGAFYGLEIDLLFVSGLLAILGYSVHDTIVVFDRIRENLRINQEKRTNEEFESVVGKSVTQTMGRSINTSLTLLITLIALFVIGSSATRDFALLLVIGVIAGTYSSVFIASPLLVTFYKLQKKVK